MEDSWKDEVYTKLMDAFGDDVESWTRVVYYLGDEDRVYLENNSTNIPPAWRTLKASMNYSDAAFQAYAKRLAKETMGTEKDQGFRETMTSVHEEFVEPFEVLKIDDDDVPDDAHGFDVFGFAEKDTTKGSAIPIAGFLSAFSVVPLQYLAKIVEILPKIISNGSSCVGSFVSKHGGSIVVVGLATVAFGYVVVKNIRRWRKDEITWKMCAKNIIDAAVTCTAGLAGAVGGAAIGSLAGPIGAIVGAIVGGIVSANLAKWLCGLLTKYLFGTAKEEELDDDFFDL